MAKKIKTKFLIKIIPYLSFILYLFIPNKFCQAFLLTIFLLVVLSFFYMKIIEKYIIIERPLSILRLTCHEQSEITFTIKNYSRLPVFVFYLYDDISYIYVYKNKNRDIVLLRPHEIANITYKINVQERGEFFAGPLTIKFSDPFKFYTLEKQIDCKMKIVVRPARINLITEPVPGLPQGTISIKNICYEDITMRRSLREYKNGDELKRINWRASAKFGKLFTNEYQDTFDVPFFVFVNLAEEDYRLDQRKYKMERALEIAAAIVEKANQLKQRCGFAAYGTDFPYLKPALNQTDCILDILAVIKPVDGKINYNPIQKFKEQLPFGTQFFLIGPEQVDNYDSKFMAEKTDMSTENCDITRKIWK